MVNFPNLDVKTKSVPSLEKAMAILEELAKSQNGLSIGELARSLSLPKSSTYGILLTLERLGYLHRVDNTGRFMFGMKIFTLANMAMIGLNLRKLAASHLRTLMLQTNLTVHLAILERNEVVIIEKVESPYTPKVETWVGKRMGIHCTAAGKSLISNWLDEDIDRLILDGLPRYNENTIVSSKRLKIELAQVRKEGYSVDAEEETIGSRCIGSPIHNQIQQIVAAVSVAGYKQQIHRQALPSIIQSVKQTAAAISETIILNC